MSEFQVVEKFVSINGEGTRAGQLAVFVRFCGCNLNCSYCDTSWANQKDTKFVLMTGQEILEYIKQTGVKNVTLTGGEPLLQKDILSLLECLAKQEDIRVEIETNGSILLYPFRNIENGPAFTVDYKLGESGMESHMNMENFSHLTKKDTVKFVVGSHKDLEKARKVIEDFELTKQCSVYISPVFGKIELEEIVEFMKENKLNDVNMQLQMHKIIWNPEERGV